MTTEQQRDPRMAEAERLVIAFDQAISAYADLGGHWRVRNTRALAKADADRTALLAYIAGLLRELDEAKAKLNLPGPQYQEVIR